MNRWLAFVVSAVVCLGCSGGSSSESTRAGLSNFNSPPCTGRTATYRVHFVEEAGGTCGPIADVIESNASGKATADDTARGCMGRSVGSPNGCVVAVDTTCPVPNGELRDVGNVYWSQDGARGAGEVNETITVGSSSCSSIYDVTWTRQ